MQLISLAFAGGAQLPIDVCRKCNLFWFDAGEYEQLLENASKEEGDINSMSVERPSPTQEESGGDEDLGYICAALGLPVEVEHPVHTWPIATWTIAALIFIVFLFFHNDSDFQKFGFIPGDPWRLFGLTWITSFFLHANVVHVLGNLYFFTVFGDNVEEYLGKLRFVLLLFLAALCGDFFNLITSQGSLIPSVGASGGISGILIFYCLVFPNVRVAFLYRWTWVNIPAYGYIFLSVLLQLLGTVAQREGVTNVDHFAHLGGVFAGFLFWLFTRKKR